jgi:hypothetical protein
MWEKIKSQLDSFPAQKAVALAMIRHGFSVGDNGRIYAGQVEISPSKFARAIGVDRRAITAASATILGNPELKRVFLKLKPTLDLSEVAIENQLGVIELRGTAEAKAPGVLSAITNEIATRGISIRQIIADDTGLVSDPRIVIITDQKLPGDLLNSLRHVTGISEVVIK